MLRSLFERKQRRVQGLCVLEGIRLVEEALASGLHVGPLLFSPDRLSSTSAGRALRKRLEGLPQAEEIDEALLNSLSDTVTSQGVLAAVPILQPSSIPTGGLVLILDGIADPGNAGTMVRTARAAGTAGVVATKNTTDLWAPKVLRAGMGAHFHVPILMDVAWPNMQAIVGERALVLAAAAGGLPCWEFDWTQPAALVIGSEARGATSEAAQRATVRVTIPMEEGVESLNAAVAAAVLLFEARRQNLRLVKEKPR